MKNHSRFIGRVFYSVLYTIITIFIISCGNGGSNSPIQANGYLSASFDGTNSINSIQVSAGSIQRVFVSLNNSSGVVGQAVNVGLSNNNVASVSPSVCALSSGSSVNSTCMLTISGNALGSTALNITSSGYNTISLPTAVQNGPIYGTFEVESSDGTWQVANIHNNYSITSKQIQIKAGIFGSSGIESTNYAVLNFAIANASGASLSPNGGQSCANVTTVNNICTIPAWTISGSPTGAIQFTGNVAGPIVPSQNPYANITVYESAAIATPGKIVVAGQGNVVPYGMHAPIFVNLASGGESGTASLTLTSNNPNVIQFYAYNESGIASTFSTTTTCYINTSQESQLSCGFGVQAMQSSGTATITASFVSNQLGLPSIESLVLTVLPPEPAIRSLQFTNNSSTQAIWVGITQGGANAFVSPLPNGGYAQTSHNLAPGATSMCGTSNPSAACPIGATCRPGGATPGAGSPLFCYWDALIGQNGSYLMESNGGKLTVNISGSSRDPNGIIWSGNFFARTKCNESGVCEIGDCGNDVSAQDGGFGLACAPATGPATGVNTLGEFTFQEGNNPDFYDVSLINGINFALQFGPNQTSNPFSSSNAYTCGVAGSLVNQGSWPSTNGLPAANWVMHPESASVYPFDGSVNDAQIYYSWVDGDSSAQQCSSESCTGGLVCGYHINSKYFPESGINQGPSSYYQQYCGHRIAWITADSIGGFNNTTSNGAAQYFNFNAFWANPVVGEPITPSRGNNNIYVTNLQMCNMNTFSSYQNPAPTGNAGNTILACGGVDWSNYNSQNIARVNDASVTTSNPNWESNVLPTIGWIKKGCPTCYTFPYDDPSSTFTCTPGTVAGNATSYNATFSDLH